MKDMYDRYHPCHEPCGAHPQWTPYPHAGHPPKSYYMTAYDIAVLHGYTGTVDEWLDSLGGANAYEVWKTHHPESTLTEDEWVDAENCIKQAVIEADERVRQNAESAAQSAAHVDAVAESIPRDFGTLADEIRTLRRKVAALSAGVLERQMAGAVCQKYAIKNNGDVPDLDDYTKEITLYIPAKWRKYIRNGPDVGNVASITDSGTIERDSSGNIVMCRSLGGWLNVVAHPATSACFQIFIPAVYLSDETGAASAGLTPQPREQIWVRAKHMGSTGFPKEDGKAVWRRIDRW